MADFNQPALTSLYADMVNVLKERDISALQWLDGTTDSNIPSGAKRWNTTNSYFEKFNGSTWSALTAKYMIDVDKVDGCTVNDLGTSTTDLWTASKINTALGTKLAASAYTAADVLTKIKSVDGSASGLDADLLDGLHASSSNTGSTVVARDASGNFSAGTITADLTGTASTASTLTGLTSTVAELNFVDGVTSNIQTQLNGKVNTADVSATSIGNTIVLRDDSSDVNARLFRSTYAEQTTMPSVTADICFRNDAASDNYMRFMSSDAFKSWLGNIEATTPVGTVVALAGSAVPVGFLECNGATISRSTYSGLFSKISTLYGAGDGSTTFKLPDLRGEFIRGWDHGRGVDTSRTLGSSQADELKSHNHTYVRTDYATSATDYQFAGSYSLSQATTLTGNTGGNETRPRNIALMYCIKY